MTGFFLFLCNVSFCIAKIPVFSHSDRELELNSILTFKRNQPNISLLYVIFALDFWKTFFTKLRKFSFIPNLQLGMSINFYIIYFSVDKLSLILFASPHYTKQGSYTLSYSDMDLIFM